MKTIMHDTCNFIEVETDRGPTLIAIDKIILVQRDPKSPSDNCLVYPVQGDFYKVSVAMSYDEMKKLLKPFGIVISIKKEG